MEATSVTMVGLGGEVKTKLKCEVVLQFPDKVLGELKVSCVVITDEELKCCMIMGINIMAV